MPNAAAVCFDYRLNETQTQTQAPPLLGGVAALEEVPLNFHGDSRPVVTDTQDDPTMSAPRAAGRRREKAVYRDPSFLWR